MRMTGLKNTKYGKSDAPARDRRRIRRVGLISPCSGNLGNAAILSSMISNLRDRIPGVEVVGITLSPEDTARRHGIETFPITGTTHGMYYLAESPGATRVQANPSGSLFQFKQALKRVGWIRWLATAVRTLRLELKHIARSARLIKTLDYAIVSGGGALDDFWGGPWGHPWTLFKFAVLSRIYGVPFLFVSVGMCTLTHPLSRRFAGGALRLAQYRSYRDAESGAILKKMFPRLSVAMWPDLAFGYCLPTLPPYRPAKLSGKPLLVAVSPIAYFDPRAWPEKDSERYLRYLDELTRFLKWAIGVGHELILFATDGSDIETVNDLLKRFSPAEAAHLQILPNPPLQTTENLLKSVCHADLVVASRLHGVILSHLIAKPAIAISYDRKVDAHMSEIGQFDYRINIDEFSSETLTERFLALQDVAHLESAHVERAVQQDRERIQDQLDLLFGKRTADSPVDENRDQLLARVQQ